MLPCVTKALWQEDFVGWTLKGMLCVSIRCQGCDIFDELGRECVESTVPTDADLSNITFIRCHLFPSGETKGVMHISPLYALASSEVEVNDQNS